MPECCMLPTLTLQSVSCMYAPALTMSNFQWILQAEMHCLIYFSVWNCVAVGQRFALGKGQHGFHGPGPRFAEFCEFLLAIPSFVWPRTTVQKHQFGNHGLYSSLWQRDAALNTAKAAQDKRCKTQMVVPNPYSLPYRKAEYGRIWDTLIWRIVSDYSLIGQNATNGPQTPKWEQAKVLWHVEAHGTSTGTMLHMTTRGHNHATPQGIRLIPKSKGHSPQS